MHLFLDFDGVLHPEGSSADHEFCRLRALEEALRELPSQPVIVISSSWRFDHSLQELRSMFSADIAGHIAGVTPNINARPTSGGLGCRQREIEAWMEAHAPDQAWIALDDHADGFEGGCPNLILTRPHLGVQFDDLEELTRRLGASATTPLPRRLRP